MAAAKTRSWKFLLQACIYCGVPAAMDSLRVAKENFSGDWRLVLCLCVSFSSPCAKGVNAYLES